MVTRATTNGSYKTKEVVAALFKEVGKSFWKFCQSLARDEDKFDEVVVGTLAPRQLLAKRAAACVATRNRRRNEWQAIFAASGSWFRGAPVEDAGILVEAELAAAQADAERLEAQEAAAAAAAALAAATTTTRAATVAEREAAAGTGGASAIAEAAVAASVVAADSAAAGGEPSDPAHVEKVRLAKANAAAAAAELEVLRDRVAKQERTIEELRARLRAAGLDDSITATTTTTPTAAE